MKTLQRISSILLIILSATKIMPLSHNFKHGLSIMKGSYEFSRNNNTGKIEILSYRILDTKTGLGLTTNIINLGLSTEQDIIFNGENSFFDLEFNWEPLYIKNPELGLGIFYKIDNYYLGIDSMNHDIGFRIDARIKNINDNFIPLALGTAEIGYHDKKGAYLSLKIDIFTGVLLF